MTPVKRARLVASMPSVAVKFGECHAPYLTPAMMVALPSSDCREWLITDLRCLNSGATRAAQTPISKGRIASHGKTSRIFTIVHAPKLGLQPLNARLTKTPMPIAVPLAVPDASCRCHIS